MCICDIASAKCDRESYGSNGLSDLQTIGREHRVHLKIVEFKGINKLIVQTKTLKVI